MNTEDLKNVLAAIKTTLDGIQMRTDQVKDAAKINACSRKLAEIVNGLGEKQDETENQ